MRRVGPGCGVVVGSSNGGVVFVMAAGLRGACGGETWRKVKKKKEKKRKKEKSDAN